MYCARPRQRRPRTAVGHADSRDRTTGRRGNTPLADQDFFKTLLASDSGPQYRACRTGQAKNYAAASDVLRYPLIDAHGGVYMDVGNTFATAHADLQLRVGPEDVLLDDAVVLADVPYSGYNGHAFASHPDNPVLKVVTRAMQARFKARPDFYAKPRPILKKGASTSETRTFWRYVKDTFEMTGPQLLDDALCETRPDYYDLLLRADLKQSLGISSQAYERQLTACVEHYFPFAGRVEVEVGNLHS
ncbi:glycosyltransferase [Pseudomonas coleopterorum]|uniref:Glycosyltransferase n=1 Tax=Pseudomonas coleopterorum TaxID=1605838 RepID=A0AAJ6M0A4_9PSED|nr:glycosyltransferase [Pseudomonas coleopterorum]WNC10277.1 glycosyltransferase [Pseudomonas coleopterorum]